MRIANTVNDSIVGRPRPAVHGLYPGLPPPLPLAATTQAPMMPAGREATLRNWWSR